MPWLVLIFGIMIVPSRRHFDHLHRDPADRAGNVVHALPHTAAAMLMQIPYFCRPKWSRPASSWCAAAARGHPLLRVLLFGDTDEGPDEPARERFRATAQGDPQRYRGGRGSPCHGLLLASMALGVWLMFTRLTLGTEGLLADADHLIGALALNRGCDCYGGSGREPSGSSTSPLGTALVITALVADATPPPGCANRRRLGRRGSYWSRSAFPRGKIRRHYGDWSRFVV